MVRKLIFTVIAFGLAVGFILPQLVVAGTTGKISGTVTNEETGEPLPGVAVSIVGTKMGALTDENGEYFILNVPVGTYTLKASLIGFAPVEVVNLSASIDLTTYNDFALSKKALELGKTIVVTAERPLVIKDKTASIKLVEAEEIQNMPTRGYQDIVGLQAGVVRFRDNPNIRNRGDRENSNTVQLNIRGGRSSEVAYFVDGFSQQDPLSGISTTNINNNALNEVEITTGGFSAEYGWVSSGIVNATTKEGTEDFSGALETVTDNIVSDNYDYNLYAANIGGPLPGLEGSTFFLSGERRWQGDRQPSAVVDEPLPNNDLGGWSGQGKLALRLNDNMNFKVGGLYTIDNWQEYRQAYYFAIDHTPRYEDQNGSIYGKWTHTLSPKTFYSAAVSYFFTERKRGDGVHFDDIEAYHRFDSLGQSLGNATQDKTGLFWSFDDIDSVTADIDEGHYWDDYLQRRSSYIGFDFDITSQVTPRHMVKVGVDFQRHVLRYYRHLFPTNPGAWDDIDHYGYDHLVEEFNDGDVPTDTNGTVGWQNDARTPITFAFYAQDKFEWSDLVINAGLRFDYFDTRAKRVIDIERPFDPDGGTDLVLDEDTDLEDSKAETRLSPRIGVAFPVSDRTVVHVSYGLFFQRPDLNNLYVGYDYIEYKVNAGGYYYPFGNPNLQPEKTTAYEFGFAHQMGENTSFDVTAFYKDVSNLTQVVTIPAYPKSYSLFLNDDFGTIKGLDFTLTMRRVKNMMLNLNYTLSWANGTGSFANTQRNIAWTSSEIPVQSAPLDFDQRHKFTGIVDIRAGRGEGPILGDIYPLENAGINFIFNLSSGTPYSPVKLDADPATLYAVAYTPSAPRNSRYSDWKFRIDLKANKTLYLGRASLDLYVWVLNLLDRDNTVAVFESSGDGEATNWVSTEAGEDFLEARDTVHDATGLTGQQKYELKQADPANFDIPRQIRFGVRLSF
ncbi:MAG: TonB-dependent receptor [Candidatus Zixiibacteriota bacterium]|nr:MAG: TonB-dependent receptor [candidate division Zixibacteria bacterium]